LGNYLGNFGGDYGGNFFGNYLDNFSWQFWGQIFNLPGIFNFHGLPQRLETLLHHQNAACFYAKDFHVLRTSERKPDVAASA
jgi:hypothetical protein